MAMKAAPGTIEPSAALVGYGRFRVDGGGVLLGTKSATVNPDRTHAPIQIILWGPTTPVRSLTGEPHVSDLH